MDYALIVACFIAIVAMSVRIGYKIRDVKGLAEKHAGQLIIGYDDGVPYIFLDSEIDVEEMKQRDHVVLDISLANDSR